MRIVKHFSFPGVKKRLYAGSKKQAWENIVKYQWVVAQTDYVLRQAQHERKKFMISNARPFALSLSKGERGLGNNLSRYCTLNFE
jgi:hypothetical protein